MWNSRESGGGVCVCVCGGGGGGGMNEMVGGGVVVCVCCFVLFCFFNVFFVFVFVLFVVCLFVCFCFLNKTTYDLSIGAIYLLTEWETVFTCAECVVKKSK